MRSFAPLRFASCLQLPGLAACAPLVGLLTVAPAPAHAQATGAPAPELPAMTVTDSAGSGDYRAPDAALGVLGERRLLDTPFSIQVITRDLIEHQQAQTYGDYLKNDPSSTVGNVPVGFNSLRGFSVGSGGYLFDGLPGSQPLNDARFQVIGVERIEILKGPSAFLYGLGASTSLGGTLNFGPKRPTEMPLRSIATGVTSRSVFSASADLGDRFGSDRQFGYRLNVGAKDGEQASRGADWQQQAATLALDWRASRDLVVSGGFEYARNRYPRLQPFYSLAPGVEVPRAPDARNNVAQPWDDFRVDGSNLWLRADWQLAPDWTLVAQGLHSTNVRANTKEARFGLVTDTLGSATLFGAQDGGSKGIGDTAQVALRGTVRTGPLSHAVTVSAASTRTESRAGTSTSLGLFPTNLYRPVASPEPFSSNDDNGPLLPTQRTRSDSLLLSDIATFDAQWSLLLGLRHARLAVDNLERETGATLTRSALEKTTPTAALMFKPTPASLLYLNYAQGIEPGGTAPDGTFNQGQVLSPIVTRQVELGAKLEAAGLLWTAALFDMRKPLEYVDAGSRTYVQNGLQRHKGLELSATGRLTPDLSVVAGLMWLDPRSSNTGDASTEGKRPLGVPRVVANLFADWRIAAVPGLFVNGGVYHAGSQFLDGANTQKVPGWTRLDAGLRYETRLGATPTTLLFNVENLADKRYWSGAQSGLLTLAEPRTFKLAARFNF